MEIDLESQSRVDSNVDEEGDENTMSSQDSPIGGKKKRKKFSKVWQHFTELPLGKDNIEKSKCNRCGAVYHSATRMGTGSTHKCRGGKFSHEHFHDLITRALIMHDLPFSFVEYCGIRNVFRYLHPEIELVSRNTAKSDVLKLYEKEKGRIRNLLHDTPSRISLTSNGWTSINSDGYVCLTAHFVDKDWKLQKCILNFSYMPPPHTDVALSEKLYGLISDWGFEEKVFALTLDNASDNAISVDILKMNLNIKGFLVSNGDLFHMRCCAHILNLVVQEGLKHIDASICKIRDSVKYVKGSQARKENFLECARSSSVGEKRGLCQDVPTRWNSTYLMLDSAIHYRLAFQQLALSDGNYLQCPSSGEWDKVEKIRSFLEYFYNATLAYSGTAYPTANLFFPYIWRCCICLKDHMNGDDTTLKSMATQMWGKFQKYWSEFNINLAIACVLDPRYKLHFIEYSYKKLYGEGSLEFKNVNDKLISVFDEYMVKSTNVSALKTNIPCATDRPKKLGRLDLMFKEFDEMTPNQYSNNPIKTELQLYLEEPKMNRTDEIDVLLYWQSNQSRYPALASMARDVLAVPVSTVAFESPFSSGGRVLDAYRSRLRPNTAEALICTRDWLYGDKGLSSNIEDLTEDIFNFKLNDTHEDLVSLSHH